MQITLDLFPCNFVAVPPGFIADVNELSVRPPHKGAAFRDVCRILVADGNLVIAQDSPTGAQIIFQEKIAELYNGVKPEFLTRVVTESGKMVVFYKDNGCGCSSRLRSWNPYKTLSSNNE